MKAGNRKLVFAFGIIVVSVVFGAFYFTSEEPPDTTFIETNPANNKHIEEKDFVFAFYSDVAKAKPDSNLFFSPFSISSAFSMAFEGARGNTASEIQKVFGFISDNQERRASIAETLERLGNKDDLYKLQIANALWIKENYPIKQEYLDTATTYYDSTVDAVDFVTDDGINKINNWTNKKTQGKIQDILPPGSTDELTRMVITNAIYFQGKWGEPFEPGNISEESFWTDKDKSVTVPMMKIPAEMFRYHETKDLQALEMHYVGGDISMLILLPNDRDGLKSVEDSMNMQKLNSIRDMMTLQPLTVQIPKFEFETKYDLTESLERLGMHDAFDENIADFKGMTDEQVFLDKALHKVFVNVNEEGTEVAAITALVVQAQSGPPDPRHNFIANHPFMFVIQENETVEVLFIGRIANPLI